MLFLAADDDNNLFPILLSVGLLVLLALLLFGLLFGLYRCKRRHSSKDTTSSNEPIADEDNEVEWMQFENPSLYDIRSANNTALQENGNPENPESTTEIADLEVSAAAMAADNVDGRTPRTSGNAADIISARASQGSTTLASEGSSAPNSARGSRGSGGMPTGAAATPIAIVGGKKPSRFQKRSSKQPAAAQRPPSAKRPEKYTFDLAENQKVATVLQRIVGRMRNKLSSVRWTETDNTGMQQQPPDITINMPVTGSNTSLNTEKGMKTLPGSRLVYIPPKLHEPPRGWAPASHNVPMGGIKSSWGKAKNRRRREQQGLDIEDKETNEWKEHTLKET